MKKRSDLLNEGSNVIERCFDAKSWGASTDWKFPNCSFARLRMARILLQLPDETFTIAQVNTNQMILFFPSILPFPRYLDDT